MKASGSNEERRNALLATISARVRYIREYLGTGEPAGFQLPATMLQFRKMDFPELCIFPIESPSTLNAKQNPTLAGLLSVITLLLKHLKVYQKHPVILSELDFVPIQESVICDASRLLGTAALASEIAVLVGQLECLEKLGRREKAPSMSEIIRRLRRDKRRMDLTIAGLSRANHEQAVEIERIRISLSMADTTVASLTEELTALRRQHGEMVFRVVRPEG
ncbi:hypothetical protein AB4Y42_11390 [Paraburkholderia sp. EG286B]|uniref:hypothetical protein n=1 Tax=Paraburkholderia sp. EG286B TaxID=3237011 RepID=UPI0034D253AF